MGQGQAAIRSPEAGRAGPTKFNSCSQPGRTVVASCTRSARTQCGAWLGPKGLDWICCSTEARGGHEPKFSKRQFPHLENGLLEAVCLNYRMLSAPSYQRSGQDYRGSGRTAALPRRGLFPRLLSQFPPPDPPKSLSRNNSPHSKPTERKPTILAVTAIFLREAEGLSLCRACLASGAGLWPLNDAQTKARAF